MPLLNYTTSIEAARTIMEIQAILTKHGARAILTEYDEDGGVKALSFKVLTPHGELGFKLPVDPEAILRVLGRQGIRGKSYGHPQAVRIAWRIVKDWIAAQMALLETEMVKLEQIFLPYAVTRTGKTLYVELEERHFKMLGPGEASEESNR